MANVEGSKPVETHVEKTNNAVQTALQMRRQSAQRAQVMQAAYQKAQAANDIQGVKTYRLRLNAAQKALKTQDKLLVRTKHAQDDTVRQLNALKKEKTPAARKQREAIIQRNTSTLPTKQRMINAQRADFLTEKKELNATEKHFLDQHQEVVKKDIANNSKEIIRHVASSHLFHHGTTPRLQVGQRIVEINPDTGKIYEVSNGQKVELIDAKDVGSVSKALDGQIVKAEQESKQLYERWIRSSEHHEFDASTRGYVQSLFTRLKSPFLSDGEKESVVQEYVKKSSQLLLAGSQRMAEKYEKISEDAYAERNEIAQQLAIDVALTLLPMGLLGKGLKYAVKPLGNLAIKMAPAAVRESLWLHKAISGMRLAATEEIGSLKPLGEAFLSKVPEKFKNAPWIQDLMGVLSMDMKMTLPKYQHVAIKEAQIARATNAVGSTIDDLLKKGIDVKRFSSGNINITTGVNPSKIMEDVLGQTLVKEGEEILAKITYQSGGKNVIADVLFKKGASGKVLAFDPTLGIRTTLPQNAIIQLQEKTLIDHALGKTMLQSQQVAANVKNASKVADIADYRAKSSVGKSALGGERGSVTDINAFRAAKDSKINVSTNGPLNSAQQVSVNAPVSTGAEYALNTNIATLRKKGVDITAKPSGQIFMKVNSSGRDAFGDLLGKTLKNEGDEIATKIIYQSEGKDIASKIVFRKINGKMVPIDPSLGTATSLPKDFMIQTSKEEFKVAAKVSRLDSVLKTASQKNGELGQQIANSLRSLPQSVSKDLSQSELLGLYRSLLKSSREMIAGAKASGKHLVEKQLARKLESEIAKELKPNNLIDFKRWQDDHPIDSIIDKIVS